MSRRTDLTVVSQVAARHVDPKVPERVSQMLLPLVTALLQTKQDMMSFVWKIGHGAVDAVFKAEADALLGPAGKRKDGRELYRWGTVKAEFPLGGRRVTMPCPRVRRRERARSVAGAARFVCQASSSSGRQTHCPRGSSGRSYWA